MMIAEDRQPDYPDCVICNKPATTGLFMDHGKPFHFECWSQDQNEEAVEDGIQHCIGYLKEVVSEYKLGRNIKLESRKGQDRILALIGCISTLEEMVKPPTAPVCDFCGTPIDEEPWEVTNNEKLMHRSCYRVMMAEVRRDQTREGVV